MVNPNLPAPINIAHFGNDPAQSTTPWKIASNIAVVGHRHGVPFGIRDQIIRNFAHPDKIVSTPYCVDFFGLTYSGDLSQFLDWEVYYYGAYEIEVLSLLDDIFDAIGDSHSCFVDVGANVGQHSLFVGRRGIRVICFEPWSSVRSVLEGHVHSNNLIRSLLRTQNPL